MNVTRHQAVRAALRARPRVWLVTGAAGFIGSHLVEELLRLGQRVRGLDNFATGRRCNLEEVCVGAGAAAWRSFEFREGDVTELWTCQEACQGVHVVLHQAALASVPGSMERPLDTHAANVTGTLNVMLAAREAGCARFVYASSSAVYGDHPDLPKREDKIGTPLSPYAASKRMAEIYAATFHAAYGFPAVGLRYFNVYGPRQDPAGGYAAVIPRWICALLRGEQPVLYGDGETSRDFCYVADVVQANLLAAQAPAAALGRVFNIAQGGRTTLKQLYQGIRDGLVRQGMACAGVDLRIEPARPGDVRHSVADISRAADVLGYAPEVGFEDGLDRTLHWFRERA